MEKTQMKTTTKTKTNTNWDETREYFKEKTEVFKEVKRRRHIEIMKEELKKEMLKYNKNKK